MRTFRPFTRHALARRATTGALLAIAACLCLGQAEPEVKIVKPVVDKAAGVVTLPGMFWNAHSADWIEVALCGKPSDFLHETILAATTTRALLEQSLRDIGCRDADAWADGVADFPRVRGDRFMVIVEFQRDGKKETYSLDELIEFQEWGAALGPFGFNFRGDPDRAAKAPATKPAAEAESDAVKIMKDDPQIAVQFKGLQSMSQSFADHPLAYDDWEYETINWSRNYSLLPPKVFDSNGSIPLTLTFRRVTEEQLLNESAKIWHDAGMKELMLKQLPVAKEIDKDKEEFLKLYKKPYPLPMAVDQGNIMLRNSEMVLLLMARIEKNYAALDAAWTNYAADHVKSETTDERGIVLLKDQVIRWREHMNLEAQRTEQLAIAQQAKYDSLVVEQSPGSPDEHKAKLMPLRGKELEARSRALLADNKQSLARWAAEKARLDPKNDPRDIWIKDVELHVALTQARQKSGDAGIAYGQALQKSPADEAEQTRLGKAYNLAAGTAALAEQRLALARLEFEITKRESFSDDPELPALKKQREKILEGIKELENALAKPQ